MNQKVIVMTPNASYGTANAYLLGLFQDDPGDEFGPSAYLDGADPTVPTHRLCLCNSEPQSYADMIVSNMAEIDGCGTWATTYNEVIDFWAIVFAQWSLKPIVPPGI